MSTQCDWEKMICRILLLFILTSCVCGTFVVNVTQTSYQAEENSNITLEWTFTTKPDRTLTLFYIYCSLLKDHKESCLYYLCYGVESPESQDEQFAGRVQWDKDVLREGRIRLHVSRLRTEDSGRYLCDVLTNYGGNSGTCRLNVTAAADEPKPQRPEPERPEPESWRRIALYVGLPAAAAAAAAAAVVVFCARLCIRSLYRRFVSNTGTAA